MSLATSCLIVNLQIGVEAGCSKEIIAAGASIRHHFYVNTLEWKGNGDRLLPCKNFAVFMSGHLPLVKEFKGLLTEATDKFYVRMDIDTVRDAMPVIDLSTGLLARVTSFMERTSATRLALATNDLWSRITVPLQCLAVRAECGKVREATVAKVAAAVDLVPRLNFANDDNLARVVKDVGRSSLMSCTAKGIRKDAVVRETVVAETRRILAEIEKICEERAPAA